MSEAKPEARADASRQTYASRPPSDPDRVTALLFQWETRHLGPVRRRMIAWWRSNRQVVIGGGFALILIVLGASATHDPEMYARTAELERKLAATESALKARQGELELAQLELARLHGIVDHSRVHRIPADLAGAIYDIAISEGVDPALAFSLVRVESGFTRGAVSSAGAVGFTQVMPSTAFWLNPELSYDDLFERDTNLRLGFRYLKMMLEQYDGDLHLALLAYNRGPGRVDQILSLGGDPSNGYSRNVRTGAKRKVE